LVVTVRFFPASWPNVPDAPLSGVAVALAEGATVADLVRSLSRTVGSLVAGPEVTWLVNERLSTRETRLSEGDRVMVLRPLGGG
jgi:sulfur carrier protein ThiS